MMPHHSRPNRRRLAALLAVALVALLLGVPRLRLPTSSAPSTSHLHPHPHPTQVHPVDSPPPPTPAQLAAPSHHPPILPPTLLASPMAPHPGQPHHAFRLLLQNGQCQLETIQPITGDFRTRRALPPLHAGMLLCRLTDAQGHVLAEDRLHPPDHVCVALDPFQPGSNPQPKWVRLSGTGPQVIQARLPKVPDAATFEVLRVTASQPDLILTPLLSVAVHP